MFTIIMLLCLANEPCVELEEDPPIRYYTEEECKEKLNTKLDDISTNLAKDNYSGSIRGKCVEVPGVEGV